jgi:hypothetical protein
LSSNIIQLCRARVVLGCGASLGTAALTGDGDHQQTLDLWCDLADAQVHPPAPASAPKGSEHLRDWLQPWAPRSLGLLYATSAAGESADLDGLIEQLLAEYDHRLPRGDPGLFAGLATAVRQIVADLAYHGAVTVTGADGEHDSRHAVTAAVLGTAVWTLDPQPGLTIELTDLGRHLVRQRLLEENAHVPLID